MPASFYSWLLSKGLVVFVLTVLVTPGLLEDNPGAGPSNEDELKCRKKRLIAICKKCDFRAQTEVRIFYCLWINLDQFFFHNHVAFNFIFITRDRKKLQMS